MDKMKFNLAVIELLSTIIRKYVHWERLIELGHLFCIFGLNF